MGTTRATRSRTPGAAGVTGAIAALLLALAAWAPAGAAPVGVAPLAPGWGVAIWSRTNVAVHVLDRVSLPDGAALVLVSSAGEGVGIGDGRHRLGLDPAPAQNGLAVVRVEPDGAASWATLAMTGTLSNAEGYSDLVRTDDGRVRVLANGTATVQGPTPVGATGLIVAEVDPTTGQVLGGGGAAAGSLGPVHAAAAGDDVVVSTGFVGSVEVGLSPPRTTVRTAGTGLAALSGNQLITRLDPSLTPRWATSIGPIGATGGRADAGDVAIDGGGATHVVGVHEGTVAAPGGAVMSTPWMSQRSHWVTFDVDGAPTSSIGLGAGLTTTQIVTDGAAGSTGDVVLAGAARGTVTWGSGASAVTRTVPPGERAGWLARYGPDHQPRWVRYLQSSSPTTPSALANDGAGSLTTVGSRTPIVVDGSTELPAGSHVLRVADDGTWAALARLPDGTWADLAARQIDGSLLVAGTAPGSDGVVARFGDGPGAPVLAGGPKLAFVVGGTAPVAGTGSITGTVRREGAPVAGAVVTVITPSPVLRPVEVARTGPDGTWSVAGLPPGAYRVRVVPSPYARAGTWYPDSPAAGGAGTVASVAGATTTADVSLPAATAELRVTVTLDGDPAPGAVVQVFASRGFVGASPARRRGSQASTAPTVGVVGGIPAGTYLVRAVDPVTGRSTWHAGATRPADATPLSLTGATTAITVGL